MKREPGYYWVKPKPNAQVSGEWMVMHWTGTCFWYEDEDYHDDNFEEIDERRIEREGKHICIVTGCRNIRRSDSPLCEDHFKEAIEDLSPIEPINK